MLTGHLPPTSSTSPTHIPSSYRPDQLVAAPASEAAVHIIFLLRKNLDSLDCVHLQLDHDALHACNHNALQHLTSWRHVLHKFFRAGKNPLIRNFIFWEIYQNFWVVPRSKVQQSLSVVIIVHYHLLWVFMTPFSSFFLLPSSTTICWKALETSTS